MKIIDFLAAGSEVGAMPIVKAPTYGELRSFFMIRDEIQNNKAESFFAKHSWITQSVLDEAYVELNRNLRTLFAMKKIPSFDLVSKENVFVLNADEKRKKIIFGLIDQVHPFEEKSLEKEYYSLK